MTLNEVADHVGRGLRYEAVTEYVGIGAHGSNTHIDGIAHYSWDGNYIADPWHYRDCFRPNTDLRRTLGNQPANYQTRRPQTPP